MSKTTQNTPVAPQPDTPTVQTGVTPIVQTADTPAEVVYQPEGSLPPITSLDELSHIRAIDKQGRSVTMTPAQLRELTGIDYSKLEEQIVPGEYLVDSSGVKRQVYTCTLKIAWTFPAVGVWDGTEGAVASDVIDCFGLLRVNGVKMSLTNPIYGIEFQMTFANGKLAPQIRATSATYAGKAYTYVVVIKYLK